MLEKNICKHYISEDSKCMGTKEIDCCNCAGDTNKCDFYEEVRNKNKKVLSNRQWLESLSDADFAMWLLNKYTVHMDIEGYECNVKIGLQSLIKRYNDSYLGLFNWLREIHKSSIS